MKKLLLIFSFFVSIFFLSSLLSLVYVSLTEKDYLKNKSEVTNLFDSDGCITGKYAGFNRFDMYLETERVCNKKK